MTPHKFVAWFDLHWGYELHNRHKRPLHDVKLVQTAFAFLHDFQPDHVVFGGDMLDCAAVSHHNHGKPGRVEGLRLLSDAEELRRAVLDPVERLLPNASLTYHIGNHEDWLNDIVQECPGLEGIVDVDHLLHLKPRWKIIPQGESSHLGKLYFVHGDQIKGGEHVAKAGVLAFERNIRFGHHHTYQAYTKNSALDLPLAKTGIAVPCMCSKTPKYGEGKPNRWVQGFLWGYIYPDGTFTDYVTVAINGKFAANGKVYVP